MAGSTFLTIGPRSYGQQDAFVLALDPATGERIWAAQLGSSESEAVTDMVIDRRGRIYLAGETLGRVANGTLPRGQADVFVVELDARGRWTRAWQRGTAGDDSARAIAVDPQGRVLVGGYTTGQLTSERALGGRDGFVVQAELQPVDDDQATP